MNAFGCLGVGLMSAALTAAAGARGVEAKKPPPAAEIREISATAYTFAYPLVLMESTRRQDMERRKRAGLPAANQFVHSRTFPDEHSRLVIRPNADTLYSVAWLDLSPEPMVLHLPDSHDRYYVMQLLDAWTETFDLPGKRTRGTGERWFALVGPGWKGALPAGVERGREPTRWILRQYRSHA